MREKIYNSLKEEVHGIADEGRLSDSTELIPESPLDRYITGILYPTEFVSDQEGLVDESESDLPDREDPKTDAKLNMSGSYRPSSLGISCYYNTDIDIEIIISFSKYAKEKVELSPEELAARRSKIAYRGKRHVETCTLNKDKIPAKGEYAEFDFKTEFDTFSFGIRNHYTAESQVHPDLALITFTLINRSRGSQKDMKSDFYLACMFQTEFLVRSKDGSCCFYPYPRFDNSVLDEETVENGLLFRDYPVYAIGHGCAPMWDDSNGKSVSQLITSFLPEVELKPILPVQLDDLDLDMSTLGEEKDGALRLLTLLSDKYDNWISQKESEIPDLPETLQIAARRQITEARKSNLRIEKGITLVASHKEVWKAFSMMNRAMLFQQLRYNIPLRKIEDSCEHFEQGYSLPDPERIETWPDYSENSEKQSRFGKWRPFQIAFILMNICSIYDPVKYRDEREIADLIWFPTGGGKTEAYLGLSAFTIFILRLLNQRHKGTDIVMRYTLRLLTAQQFQRATSLICACEFLRKNNAEEFGKNRISIGLWVGSGLTPNTNNEACRLYRSLVERYSNDYKFVIRKCPWCGTEIGKYKNDKLLGLRKVSKPDRIVFRCSNPGCDYHNENIPIVVVDEQMYQDPPSLLLGTVDKFAMIPWKSEPVVFFGKGDDAELATPSLIIQDELHLISGPLGSMVGFYEMMVEELCTKTDEDGERRKPKIVGSTATISRARDQMNALYGCGKNKVSIFPQQCLDFGDSFFARVFHDLPGRMYTGLFAGSSPSFATTQVRVYSSLIHTPVKIKASVDEIDPYWTTVAYYNSLRELGHAKTLTGSDIPERLKWLQNRDGIDPKGRRYLDSDRVVELTSRASSEEITRYLQKMEAVYDGEKWSAIDICLATNMISVGLDIQRLGLMCIAGQPKSTSEYIQASSRIGRAIQSPGLVVVMYNPSKARDRSIFEHFQSFHETFYSQVEPTSVTPFSPPVRERALSALIVGLVRYHPDQMARNHPVHGFPTEEMIQDIQGIITERINRIAPEETDSIIEEFHTFLKQWKSQKPVAYGNPFNKTDGKPLLFNPSYETTEAIKNDCFPAPTSMRSVDYESMTELIKEYLP